MSFDWEHLLTDIPFSPAPDKLLRQVRMEPEAGFDAAVEAIAQEAAALARPKALYRLAVPEPLDETGVRIDGVALRSRVLRVNLDKANRVFVYVATCGTELDEWAQGKTDPLEAYWADAVKQLALQAAIQALNQDIATRYRPGPTSAMAPGSLADWPLQQQRPLFQILGDVTRRIGVTLSASYLMIPNKSVSGMRFPREESFESCMLCPRLDCPNRRAPYDPELYERQYGAGAHV